MLFTIDVRSWLDNPKESVALVHGWACKLECFDSYQFLSHDKNEIYSIFSGYNSSMFY